MQWRQDGKLRRILSSETGEEHTTQALEVRMRPSPSKSWSRTRPVAALASRGTYGVPRILEDLRDAGTHTSKRRCGRLVVNGRPGAPG